MAGGSSITTVGQTITDGSWHMITGTYNGSHLGIFVDGVSNGSVSQTGIITLINYEIFGSERAADRNWGGQHDEVAYWLNDSLTPSEILDLYNAQKDGFENGSFTEFAPNVTINFPLNITYNDTVQVQQLNYTVDTTGERCWFSIDNGVTNSSDVTTGENFTVTSVSTSNTWIVYCNNSDGEIGVDTIVFFVNKTVLTILVTPPGGSNFTDEMVSFNFTSIPINTNLTNVTLFLWNETDNSTLLTNFTILSGESAIDTTFLNILEEGNYKWNVETCGIDVACVSGTSNNSFIIHLTAPNITIHFPTSSINIDHLLIGNNLTLNWTIIELTQNLTAHVQNCSYEYNGTMVEINKTICLELNETSFTYALGVNNLTLSVVDIFGLVNSVTTSWTLSLIEINQTFNNQTIEGSTETFTIVLVANESISSANLIYNGTITSADIDNSNFPTVIISESITIPEIESNVNFSFFWNVVSASFDINITANNQTVINASLDNCSVFTNVLFNYTMVDEATQVVLDGPVQNVSVEVDISVFSEDKSLQIINFSVEFSDTNSNAICSQINLFNSSTFVIDSTVKYSSAARVIEYYNIREFEIDNTTTTQNITLFDIKDSESTDFQITFKNSDFIVVEGALIQVNRQYVSEGTFKTVELPITDSNGQTVVHLVLNDVVYNYIVTKDGVVLGTFLNLIAFCDDVTIGQCFIQLNALQGTEEAFSYDSDIGLTFSLSFNETTRNLVFTFATIDGSVKTILLSAIKMDQIGNESVCSTSVTTSSGSLTCNIASSVGNETIIVSIFVDGSLKLTQYFKAANDIILGDGGYFLLLFLVISLALMFSESKTMIIAGVILGFIAGSLFFFIKGGIIGFGSAIIWLIIQGIILIWKLNSDGRT